MTNVTTDVLIWFNKFCLFDGNDSDKVSFI